MGGPKPWGARGLQNGPEHTSEPGLWIVTLGIRHVQAIITLVIIHIPHVSISAGHRQRAGPYSCE